MNIRDIRQQEAAEAYCNYSERGAVINAAPRFGKIRASFLICNQIEATKVLLFYPRVDIKDGWEKDSQVWNYDISGWEYSTFRSADKVIGDFDLIIIDEIHEASVNELKKIAKLTKNTRVLGLSGTITRKTSDKIENNLGLSVCYRYSIEQAVEEEVLADYIILIHYVPLDNLEKNQKSKKGFITEKQKFDQLHYVMKEAIKTEGKEDWDTYFLMERMLINLVQNSISKKEYTRQLLKNQFHDKRVLVFCGTTLIADDLGIPAYHSKNKEKQLFDDFCSGEGLHLATIKMMQSGITIKPINAGIINYTSGNPEDTAQKICRFLGAEYDNPEKKAEIHILCTDEPFQKKRIETSLMFFDKEKIKQKKYE